jgi:hypothetical protein
LANEIYHISQVVSIKYTLFFTGSFTPKFVFAILLFLRRFSIVDLYIAQPIARSIPANIHFHFTLVRTNSPRFFEEIGFSKRSLVMVYVFLEKDMETFPFTQGTARSLKSKSNVLLLRRFISFFIGLSIRPTGNFALDKLK